jgi:predicted Fe-Mo cluster-binding NifX family protein
VKCAEKSEDHEPQGHEGSSLRLRAFGESLIKLEENMQTKIAIATEDGIHVSAHFGRALYFQVLIIEDGKIVASEQRAKAHHQGSHHEHHDHAGSDTHASGMVAVVRDCEAIIAGGMGRPAYAAIQSAGLIPILTDEHMVEDAAKAFARGTLENRVERMH